MILGFISFTLVMMQQFASIPMEYLLPFEFGHLLIFGVAMAYGAWGPTLPAKAQRS